MAGAYPDFLLSVSARLDGDVAATFAQFERAGARAGERAAQGLSRASREVSTIETNLRKASHALEIFEGPLGGVASRLSASARLFSVAGIGFAAALSGFAGGGALLFAASNVQNLQARLRALAGSQDAYNVAQYETLRIAKDSRSSLEETIRLYSRLLVKSNDYGVSQKKLGGVVGVIQKTSQVQGLNSTENASVTYEFSHAFDSNFQQAGRQLQILSKESPQLVQTIVDGLKRLKVEGFNGTVEGLRELAKEGRLNSSLVADAIIVMRGKVDAQFAQMGTTLTQATNLFKTNLDQFIIKLEESTHTLGGTANGIAFLSSHLTELGGVITVVGTAFAARFVAPLLLAVPAFVSAGLEVGALALGFRGLGAAQLTAGIGAGILQGKIAALLTPTNLVGAALTVAAAAVYYLETRETEAGAAARLMGISEKGLAAEVASTTGYILKQNDALGQNIALTSQRAIKDAQGKFSEATGGEAKARRDLAYFVESAGQARVNDPAAKSQFATVASSIRDGTLSFEAANAAIDKLDKRAPQAVTSAIYGAVDRFAIATTALRSVSQQYYSAINEKDGMAFFAGASKGDSGVAKIIADDQAKVSALNDGAHALQLAGAKRKLAIDELTKEFKSKTKSGEIEGDSSADYEARRAAIEQQYVSEVDGIKAAAKAKREAAKEARAAAAEAKRDAAASYRDGERLNSLLNQVSNEPALGKKAENLRREFKEIGDDYAKHGLAPISDSIKAQFEAGVSRLLVKPLLDANAAAREHLGILTEELSGRTANAEALQRGYALLKAGVDLSKINLATIRDQVVAETELTRAQERRNALIDIDARSRGQVQGAFTNLFAGGKASDFVKQFGQTLKQNFAEKLSISIFGNAEQEYRDRLNGALDRTSNNLGAAAQALKDADAYRRGDTNTFGQSVNTFRAAVDRFGSGRGGGEGGSPGFVDQIQSAITDAVSGPKFGEAVGAGVGDSLTNAASTPLFNQGANDNLAAGVVPGKAGNAAGIIGGLGASLTGAIGLFTRTNAVLASGSNYSGAPKGTPIGGQLGQEFGSKIGEALDKVFKTQADGSNGKLGQGEGKFASALGKAGSIVGQGVQGYQEGQVVTSALQDIGIVGKNSGSNAGGKIGAGVGAVAGSFIPGIGPEGGAFIGNILGSIIGSLFGGVTDRAFKGVQIDSTGAAVAYAQRSRGTKQTENLGTASSEAASFVDTLKKLSSTFGASLKAGTDLGEIGVYGGKYGFKGNFGDGGGEVQTFDTAEQAVAAAIKSAINKGAFEGLREGTKRLLTSAGDFNNQADKAAKYEGVFTSLKQALDPAGYAAEQVNKQFTELKAIFDEARASASEFGQLQQLYDLKRSDALKQANSELSGFLKDLTTNASSGLSARDRLGSASATLQPFIDSITAGKPIDQAAYHAAAQTQLDIKRELYGSTQAYFDGLTQITDLTKKAIEGTGVSSISPALNLAAASVPSTVTPITNSLTALQAALLASGDVTNDLLTRIAAAAANNNIAGGVNSFANGIVRNF